MCSHVLSSLCYFTISILVIKNESTVTYKANGILMTAGGQYKIFVFIELNLNQQTGKHISVNRRRKFDRRLFVRTVRSNPS